MIACIIEFGIKPGMEARNQEMVELLLSQMHRIDGFISKETFDSRNNPGKVITLSYWRDEAALAGWNEDADHRKAMALGVKEIFSHYQIQISEVSRERQWQAPN
ncbi:MAG: antibiotic biosynthesis monooxygenase family protein [Alphaproteobacteria bacterium]